MSRWPALPSILSIIICLALSACGGSDKGSEEKKPSTTASSRGSGGAGGGGGFAGFSQETKVEVLTLGRGAIAAYHVSNGNLQAIQRAPVYSRVGELCTEVLVEAGEYVVAGQPLAKLMRDEIELTRDQAAIDLERAEQTYKEAGVELERAKRYLERIIRDFEASEQEGKSSIFSLDDRFEAEITERKAALGEKRSLADLKHSRTELEAAQYQLDNTVIRAPISGVLVTRSLHPYELVTENQEVFAVADLSALRLLVDVPESAAAAIQPVAPDGPALTSADSDGEMDSADDADAAASAELDAAKEIERHRRADAKQAAMIPRAKAVILAATAFPDDRYLGYVEMVSPIVDAERGMLSVTVRVIPPAKTGDAIFEPLLAQLPVLERAAVLRTRKSVLLSAWSLLPEATRKEMSGAKPAMPAKPSDAAGPSDATLNVLAKRLPNAHERLRPGMWLEASIVTRFEKNALLIPSAAVINNTVFQAKEMAAHSGARPGVMVPGGRSRGPTESAKPDAPASAKGGDKGEGEEKVLRAVAIDLTGHTGVTSEGYVQLKDSEDAPLKAGDVIVIRGQEGLKDGGKIRVVGNE